MNNEWRSNKKWQTLNEFAKTRSFQITLVIAMLAIPAAILSTILVGPPNDTVLAIAVQADGKAVIGGHFTDDHLMRLNADGTLDESFNLTWETSGLNGPVYAIAIQPDQKILIGGDFTRFDISLAGYIVRLNPDGSIDSEFSIGTGVGFDNRVNSISVSENGKIWVGGEFGSFNGTNVGPLVALQADGTLDSAQTAGLQLDNSVYNVSAGTNSSAPVAAGAFTDYLMFIPRGN